MSKDLPPQVPLAQTIEALLRTAFTPTELIVLDESAAHAGHAGAAGGGSHFRVRIVAAAFAGQARIARHRLVYDALGSLMTQRIHALVVDARAPDDSTHRVP